MQQEEKRILARIDAGESYADIIGSSAVIEQHLSSR
jgi:hypothetical protein